MVEKRKLNNRVFVTEDDMSTLLERYTATTMLTLLQEVAQVEESKIDWNEMVKKTTTGITNAREYQMVWRHLAYRQVLLDKVDDDAQPLDDDSDLENELEAFPPVSSEASAEAAAFVKVFIASGPLCDSNMSNGNTVEGSLTIDIPNGQTSGTAANSLHGISAYGSKLRVPVTVQTQPLPSVTAAEGLDTSERAGANFPPRRKRKPWSAAEDMELIAAVEKFGEGNWVNILKADFKGDRTASQLSQRWATIRRRRGNMVGNGSQLSEAQLAARHAVSMAFGDNLRAAGPISLNGGSQSKHQQDLVPSKPIIPQNPLPKPAINPDPMVKAAAMVASSRIATHSSAAASLPMAALPKKDVHTMPGGTPAVKSSVPGSFSGLPSNVHFIRTGLVPRPAGPSNASQYGTQQQALRSASPAFHPKPMTVPSRTNASSGVRRAPSSSPTTMLEVKSEAAVSQENKTAVPYNTRSGKTEGIRAASLAKTPQQQVRKDQTFGAGNLLTEKGQGQELGGESKASRIRVQEQQESPSTKNENTKIELAVEKVGVQGPAPVTCKMFKKG